MGEARFRGTEIVYGKSSFREGEAVARRKRAFGSFESRMASTVLGRMGSRDSRSWCGGGAARDAL